MIGSFCLYCLGVHACDYLPSVAFAIPPGNPFGQTDVYSFRLMRAFGTRGSIPNVNAWVDGAAVEEPSECIAGLVLQGAKKPHECPAFGTRCTPERPLGAPMVSSEGACAAYYRYRRLRPAGKG